MGCTSRVFSAVGGCGLGDQLQRLMEVLHGRQGQSPRGTLEDLHPQTERMKPKSVLMLWWAEVGGSVRVTCTHVHLSTMYTSTCPLSYPSATVRTHQGFSYGNNGDCPGWRSPPSSIYLLPAGMNMSPVSRLKKTWAKVKTAKFFILEVNGVAGPRGVAIWPLNIATQMSPCLLPAPDGPNGEFLQL